MNIQYLTTVVELLVKVYLCDQYQRHDRIIVFGAQHGAKKIKTNQHGFWNGID